MPLWHLWASQDFEVLWFALLWPGMSSIQQEVFPIQLISLSARPPASHPILNLTYFTFLPACEINQTWQSHSPLGNRAGVVVVGLPYPHVTTKSDCHISSGLVYSQVWPLMAHSVSSSGLWVTITNKLLSISPIQCQVSWIWPFPRNWA
jgi:hypothetical protein